MSHQLGGTDQATAGGDRHQEMIQLRSDAQVGLSQSLLGELVKAGFAAEELKQAGFELRSLVSAGFKLGQLKDAGFHPSEFKDAQFTLDNLKDAGFTPEELRQAGFFISSMQAAGFNPKQLKRAGFDAAAFKNHLRCGVAELKAAGFTAKEIVAAEHEPGMSGAGALSPGFRFQSVHHDNIAKLMKDRDESGSIFGQSWLEVLGFFAPYGTPNCFWERLKKSPAFKHLFVFQSLDNLCDKPLSGDHAVPLAVSDVDAAVNTSALVCALLLSVPCAIMTSTTPEGWLNFLDGKNEWNGAEWTPCTPKGSNNLYSDFCVYLLQYNFEFLYLMTMVAFYSALCTLITSVFYYMSRPSESCNCSPLITLMGAYTLEVRDRIRKERSEQSGATLEAKPDVPFGSPNEEMEVFMKAQFLANNELEEQKNQVQK
jgi:hypothetical protein